MTLAAYIDANGLVCAVCRFDVATAGVSPGDGFLYCHGCYRDGRVVVEVEQLDLFGAVA